MVIISIAKPLGARAEAAAAAAARRCPICRTISKGLGWGFMSAPKAPRGDLVFELPATLHLGCCRRRAIPRPSRDRAG
jgi:hypothetical protein